MSVRTSRIRVLHIIKNFGLGGAETNLLNLVRALDRTRFEVHVAYSSRGQVQPQFEKEDLAFFQYARSDHKIKSPATIAIVARLVRYLREQRIDIVQTHNFNAHVWGLISAKLAGAKVLEHVHDFRYMEEAEYRRRRGPVRQFRYIRWFKNKSDRVVVLTRQNARFLLENRYYPASKVREIRNGISLGMSRPDRPASRAKLGIPPDIPVILTPARLSQEKNIGLVIDIAPSVLREAPDALFVIAGEGPQRPALEEQVRRRGVSSSVRFVGFCGDIREWLAASDVLLLPSFLELHSIAILEALSMSVPVVASSGVGCNDEMFRHGHNGFLLDPFFSRGWAEAIAGLLKDPARRREVGERGRALCREQFDMRDVAKKFERLYVELAGL